MLVIDVEEKKKYVSFLDEYVKGWSTGNFPVKIRDINNVRKMITFVINVRNNSTVNTCRNDMKKAEA